MEENQYIEKERLGLSEIYGESFRIFGENWLTYLIAAIIVGVVVGAISGLGLIFGGSKLYSLLTAIINVIVGAAITTLYIGTAYNSMRQDQKNIGALIGEKVFPIALTQLLLYLLLLIPGFVVMFAAIQLMMYSGSGGSVVAVTILIFTLAIPVALKMAFLLHSIVLSDQHYLAAIKWSFSKTKGETFRIIGINIVPVLIAVIVHVLNANGFWFSGMAALISLVVLGFIGTIVGVIVVIAITVLYIDAVMDEEETHPEAMTFIIG